VLAYRRPAILSEIPHDRHAVIEASAGTGKTYAIEYLVLDLLLNTDCSIEEILVVTFTEKATAELRTRIRSLLERVLSGSATKDHRATELVEIDDERRRRIETALFSFDRAPILTIHGFCRRILTDLAFDTGTAFGLEVVDARRVFHRAFRSTLREVLAVDEAARALLNEWMTEGETARHSNLVDSLESLLRDAHFNRYLQSSASELNRRAIEELADASSLLKKFGDQKNRKSLLDVQTAVDQLASSARGHRDSRKQLGAVLSPLKPEALTKMAARNKDPKELHLVEVLKTARAACSLDVRVVDAFLPMVAERLRSDKRQNSEIDYGDMLEEVWQSLESER
jgi:exodeoxyribonuclease V beta subunit